jgi:hypothetical protein
VPPSLQATVLAVSPPDLEQDLARTKMLLIPSVRRVRQPTALMFACLFALGACTSEVYKPADKRVEVNGVPYGFPGKDIEAFVGPSEGTLFVRLAPAGVHFHLIIDELTSDIANKQGPDVPTISRLNSNRFENFRVFSTPHGKVVCGGRTPYFNCGLQVIDQGVKWSILFDDSDLPAAEQIRAKATALITSYRTT